MNLWSMFQNCSLKWKSLMIFLALVTLPTVTLGSLVLYQSTKILTQQAIQSTDRILDTADTSLTNTIRNVEDISSYMIFSQDFRYLMMFPIKEDNSSTTNQVKNNVNGFATFHLISKNYINSITIEGRNGYRMQIGEPVHGDEQTWIKQSIKKEGGIVWSSAYPVYSDWEGTKQVISLFREINDIDNINRPIGRVCIRLNANSLLQLITSGLPRNQGTAFIVRQNGQIILRGDQNAPASDLIRRVISSPKQAWFNYVQGGQRYLVVTHELTATGWTIVALVKEQDVLKGLESIRVVTIYMLIVTTLLGFFTLLGIYYYLIRPVLSLTRETQKVEKGDFTAQVTVHSKDEIGKLGIRFNQMVATIRHLIDSKYKLEIRQKESELKALQNQIDPHFLYNTLDMIRWTARLEKAMETSRLIESLSRFFRISLSKGKIWIHLQEELQYVQSYLQLQQKRLGHKLRYIVLHSSDVSDAIVMKGILQPLVENSIVHGLQGLSGTGNITVRCYAVEDFLWMDVIDNGRGFSDTSFIEHSDGFALNNIHERLKAAFGSSFHMQLVKLDQPGAWIQIRIPLRFHEQDKQKSWESGVDQHVDEDVDS